MAALFAVPSPEPEKSVIAYGPIAALGMPTVFTHIVDRLDSETREFLRQAPADIDQKLLELWLHGRCPHTQRTYAADLARFRNFCSRSFPLVTLIDLQAFADSLAGLAPRTRGRILSSVKSLLAFGHRVGILPFDVGRALELPRAKDGLAQRILPESSMHTLIRQEKRPRDRVLLRLLYVSGCRVSELCALRWSDVQANTEGAVITVYGKGEKTRWIHIPSWDAEELFALRDGAAPPALQPAVNN